MPAGNTYVAIATQTVSGTSTQSITFSSIPSTYTDLVLVVVGGTASQGDNIFLRFNSDSGTNYSYTELRGNGSAASSARASNQNAAYLQSAIGGGATLGQNYIANIMNYSNTTTNKTVISRANQADGSTSYPGVGAYVNLWRNTAAITTVLLGRTGAGASLQDGTVVSLYGIAAA
jgi:hypothetical protein